MPTLSPQGLLAGLRSSPKTVPCGYLYDKRGSELYEQITELEEYYPFKAEHAILEQHAEDIITHVPKGSVIVELGCGTARKTGLLLSALIKRDGRCKFAGIDVSASFLEEAKENLLGFVPDLRAEDIDLVEAEYIAGLHKVRQLHPTENLCILWLGSSVGNLTNDGAAQFFKDMLAAAGQKSQVFLCTDLWKEKEVLYAAYHDSKGVTEEFILNGLRNALLNLGLTPERLDAAMKNWVYEVVVSAKMRRVEMWVHFKEGLEVFPGKNGEAIRIAQGERLLMELSRKFTVGDINRLATVSGYFVQAAWRTRQYGVQMLLPMEEALRRCWRDTDDFFLNQVKDWSTKPITMRHPFLFYYGHVNSFTKIKALPHVPPSPMDVTFSRGIDPVVLDPSKCHKHPEVPPQWPSREEVLSYVAHTRGAVMDAVEGHKCSPRLLQMCLEHERMHQETLTYMLTQARRAEWERDPPAKLPGAVALPRDWAKKWERPSVRVSAGRVVMGVDATEAGAFVWDNEGPPLETKVPLDFMVASEPVTIGQWRNFIVEKKGYDMDQWWDAADLAFFRSNGLSQPATWSRVKGDFYIHRPEGVFHWTQIANEPVLVSLTEALAFCKSLGYRIISETEYQRLLDSDKQGRVKQLRDAGWEWTSSHFAPFPGFKPMPEYPEYSTDFFDDCHFVLRGSSSVTHPSVKRDSFRNYYQKQYPYMFAKFRLCSSVHSVAGG